MNDGPLDIKRVARLSRLFLSEDELTKVEKKFANILASFEALNSCSTEGVEPLYHATERSNLRADVAEPALSTESLLKNAPSESQNCFQLPRVVSSES